MSNNYKQILNKANLEAKKTVKSSASFFHTLSKKDKLVFRQLMANEISYFFTLLSLKDE